MVLDSGKGVNIMQVQTIEENGLVITDVPKLLNITARLNISFIKQEMKRTGVTKASYNQFVGQ